LLLAMLVCLGATCGLQEGGPFFSNRSATRFASFSLGSWQSACPSSCRIAKSNSFSRPMRQMPMSSTTRTGGPPTKASSKNVALPAGSVSAGTPGFSLLALNVRSHRSERTRTQVHSPSSVRAYLATAFISTANLIETLPRRGYRFIATLKETEAPQNADKEQSPAEVVDNGLIPPTRVRPTAWRYAIASGATVLILGAVLLIYGKMHSVATPRQRALTRITFDKGLQFGATWSPDGRYIAYSSDRGGKFDIWVQQVSGGDPVQITTGPGHNWQPDWSPDGRYIAYRSEDGDGGLFVIPALGGMGLR